MMSIIPFGPARDRIVKKVLATASGTREVMARLIFLTIAVLLAVASVDPVFRQMALPDVGGPVGLHRGQFAQAAEATLFHLHDGPGKACDGIVPSGQSVAAFIPADDATARSAFLAVCAVVDHLFLEDMVFGAEVGTVILLVSDGWSADLAALGRPTFLMLTARFDAPGGSKGPLLADPAARARLLRDLEANWPARPGLCLDLSGNGTVSPQEVRDLLVALRPLAEARGTFLLTLTGSVTRRRNARFLPASRRAAGARSPSSTTQSSIANAIGSRTCLPGSRTGDASQPATTAARSCSCPPVLWPQPSWSGCES